MFQRYDQWMLLAHGAEPPADPEWHAYVEGLHQLDGSGGVGVVVLTDGVGPNALQRKMMTGFKMKSVVITTSKVARGIVTALGWIGAAVSAFPPEQFDEALLSVDVPRFDVPAIMASMAKMRLTLAGKDELRLASATQEELQAILNQSMEQLAKL